MPKMTLLQLAAYPHLYSYTSTKSVVHWFQIIRTKSFQMYDDDVQTPFSMTAIDRYYKVAKFPTRNIKTPIVLIYGGSDSLVDIHVMLKELPGHTIAKEIPSFEHLDFLWAEEVHQLVFPTVFEALRLYTNHSHSARFQPMCINNLESDVPGSASSEDELSPQVSKAHGKVKKGEQADHWSASTHRAVVQSKRQSFAHSTCSSTEPTSISGDERIVLPKRIGTPWRSGARHDSRSGSRSNMRSFEGASKVNEAGITIGASHATTGNVTNTGALNPIHDTLRPP